MTLQELLSRIELSPRAKAIAIVAAAWVLCGLIRFVAVGQADAPGGLSADTVDRMTSSAYQTMMQLFISIALGPMGLLMSKPLGDLVGVVLLIVGVPVGFVLSVIRVLPGTTAHTERQMRRERKEHALRQGRLPEIDIVEQLRLRQPGVPIATVNGALVGSPQASQEHIAVAGSTGAGKGLHLTQTLLCWHGPAVVFDPKGEQFERTAGYREDVVGPCYRIGPQAIDLAELFDLSSLDAINELSQHLLRGWLDGGNQSFADKARFLIWAADLYAKGTGLHVMDVLADWATTSISNLVNRAYAYTVDPRSGNNVLDAFLDSDPGNRRENRFASSAHGVFSSRFLDFIGSIDLVTHRDIPRDWRARNGTIYICFPPEELDSRGPLISAMMAGLMRDAMHQRSATPTLFVLDELAALKPYNLAHYLNLSRAYGIRFLVYLQSIAQLDAIYGKDAAQSILSNCRIQVFYSTKDERTSEYASRILGTKIDTSRSLSQAGGSMNEQIRPEMSPSEVLTMPDEWVICLMNNYRFKGRRVDPRQRLPMLPRPPVIEAALRQRKPMPTPAQVREAAASSDAGKNQGGRQRPDSTRFF